MITFKKTDANLQIVEAFKNFSWQLYTADINESLISSFAVTIQDEESLEKSWKYIATRIAALYQSQLKDDYSAWNIYLLFNCNSKISRTLQYEIENDKFSMRKIINYTASEPTTLETIKMINNEILGLSLESCLQKKTSIAETRKPTELQNLFTEFGVLPTDNKLESKNKREDFLNFLLSRIA